MARVIRHMTIEVVYECDEKDVERVDNFVVGAYKQAPRNIRKGAVAMIAYRDDGEAGKDMTPARDWRVSDEFREATEELFEDDGKV